MATTKIEKLKVVVLPIGSITLDPDNAVTHDARNIEDIAASLQRFGQRTPVVLRQDGVVIKGNGTVLAARSLGWDKINAVRCELVGVEAKAYAIADNRTAEFAEWDNERLADILSEITDLSGTGFSQAELDELLESVLESPENHEPTAASPGENQSSGHVTQEGSDESGKLKEVYQVVVECADEESQADLLERLDQEGYKVRAIVG